MDFPSHLQRWSDSLSVTRWYLLRNAHQGRSTSGEGTREHRVKHSKAYLEAFVFNVSGLCGCSLSTRHRRLVYHLSSVQVTPVRTHPRHPPFPYGHLLTLMGFWAGALSFAPPPSGPCDSFLPHEAQEHQHDQADEPASGGEGLGHGERAGAHDEVKHVHQSNLEPREVTVKPRN